ncbi:hypothetical protein XENORESO_013846 [Xenotaenia resolanae]|uniref:Uncharacterized protein n=1 Tax=Xenotaenia resolanae TaxID=208358 RepID=A0ABV0W2T5_9TELE
MFQVFLSEPSLSFTCAVVCEPGNKVEFTCRQSRGTFWKSLVLTEQGFKLELHLRKEQEEVDQPAGSTCCHNLTWKNINVNVCRNQWKLVVAGGPWGSACLRASGAIRGEGSTSR